MRPFARPGGKDAPASQLSTAVPRIEPGMTPTADTAPSRRRFPAVRTAALTGSLLLLAACGVNAAVTGQEAARISQPSSPDQNQDNSLPQFIGDPAFAHGLENLNDVKTARADFDAGKANPAELQLLHYVNQIDHLALGTNTVPEYETFTTHNQDGSTSELTFVCLTVDGQRVVEAVPLFDINPNLSPSVITDLHLEGMHGEVRIDPNTQQQTYVYVNSQEQVIETYVPGIPFERIDPMQSSQPINGLANLAAIDRGYYDRLVAESSPTDNKILELTHVFESSAGRTVIYPNQPDNTSSTTFDDSNPSRIPQILLLPKGQDLSHIKLIEETVYGNPSDPNYNPNGTTTLRAVDTSTGKTVAEIPFNPLFAGSEGNAVLPWTWRNPTDIQLPDGGIQQAGTPNPGELELPGLPKILVPNTFDLVVA